jgi:hypothetical protein
MRDFLKWRYTSPVWIETFEEVAGVCDTGGLSVAIARSMKSTILTIHTCHPNVTSIEPSRIRHGPGVARAVCRG